MAFIDRFKAFSALTMEQKKEEMAEIRVKRNAMERDLYGVERDEKLDWRRETLIRAFKKELEALRDANRAVKERYKELVRLQACIDTHAVKTIYDENASCSDKKAAQERLANDEVAALCRKFMEFSPALFDAE